MLSSLLAAIESSSSIEIATDDSSNLASSSSTPPTTVTDTDSLHSDTSKHDVITVANDSTVIAIAPALPAADVPSPRRPQRARTSLPVYNLAKLSGTSAHGKRRAKGDIVADRRRRTIAGSTVTPGDAPVDAPRNTSSTATGSNTDALSLQASAGRRGTPRAQRLAKESPRSLRSTARVTAPSGSASAGATPVSAVAAKLSVTSKRGRKTAGAEIEKEVRLTRELRRLQDTKEYNHIDDRPVVHSVWSNGKYVDPSQAAEPQPARKKARVEQAEIKVEEAPVEAVAQPKKRRVKKYLNKGLYAGQETPQDITRGLTAAEKKQLAQLPELMPRRENKVMPAPIFTGFRILLTGRDFKLPFHVCNPLPPGQPKPDEWKKMTKNRFIGESKEVWKKMPHILDYQSKCVCKPEDGCGESCQNRIMLYECDDTNCNIGKARCTNRAFADLTARRARGGKYRVGVEVIKTADRGYGVRSNRCFQPHQIIMEYAGEIITEEECERRMNEVYKDNECYYLMSFDQNMIIDATTGSIARFVNHSCNPNCRMIKWIVSGQPRMALFAGDRPIMTGEELTYDYNFDPFSAKNVQKCLCGQPNCRGVLGPKPKGVKPPKETVDNAAKGKAKGGKRKIGELSGNEENEEPGAKAKKLKANQPKAKPIRTLKAVKALKPVKALKSATAMKPARKQLKPVKVAQPAKGLQSVKTLKPIKMGTAKLTKAAKVSKVSKVSKASKASKASKVSKVSKVSRASQPSKKIAQTAKNGKKTSSKVSIKVVKSPLKPKGQRKQQIGSTITVSAASEIIAAV